MNVWMWVAKASFTVAVAVLYWIFGSTVFDAWIANPWWLFLLKSFFYLPAATLVFYWAGMAVERGLKHDAPEMHRIPELARYVATLIAPLAALHNAGNNLLTMTVLTFDPPINKNTRTVVELATTLRMNRYADGPDGKRKNIALFVREQLLNWADPDGLHK
jgi:hypothetical protein